MSLYDIGNKIKGIAQDAEGTIEMKTGRPLSGAINKIRGKTNQAMANLDNKETTDNTW